MWKWMTQVEDIYMRKSLLDEVKVRLEVDFLLVRNPSMQPPCGSG